MLPSRNFNNDFVLWPVNIVIWENIILPKEEGRAHRKRSDLITHHDLNHNDLYRFHWPISLWFILSCQWAKQLPAIWRIGILIVVILSAVEASLITVAVLPCCTRHSVNEIIHHLSERSSSAQRFHMILKIISDEGQCFCYLKGISVSVLDIFLYYYRDFIPLHKQRMASKTSSNK